MKIRSEAFGQRGNIPSSYTCDGEDKNPPLEFVEVPGDAKALALIVDDPDAPSGDFVHWLVWNIDPKLGGIDEGSVPEGAHQGTTSFDKTGYGGPCPPSGTHRYFFKLYALDKKLDLPATATKDDLLAAMEEHILEDATLIGRYSKR